MKNGDATMNQNARHGKSAGFRGKARQRGYATLLVAVIALLLLTIMTFYFSRVAVMDQRMSGNEARYKEAFSAAMFGLDTGVLALDDSNPSTLALAVLPGCSLDLTPTPFAYTLPNNGQQQTIDVCLTRSQVAVGGDIYYTVTSTGTSTDGTGSATVSRQYTLERPLDLGMVSAPLVVGGVMNAGGGFEVVANPEGYCIGTWNGAHPDAKITDADYCAHPDDDRDRCFSSLTQGSNPPVSILAEKNVTSVSAAFGSCYPPGDPNAGDLYKRRGWYPEDPDPPPQANKFVAGAGCDKTAGTTPEGQNLTLAPSGNLESSNKNFSGRAGFDIWDNIAGFPPDLFQAVFGQSPDILMNKIDAMKHKIQASECGNAPDADHPDGHLDGDIGWSNDPVIDSSSGFWWVEGGGTCKLSGLIGARDTNGNGFIDHDPNGDKNFDDSELHPAIIIVDESDLDIAGNTAVYGIIFFLDRNGDNSIKLNGGGTVHGSIMANRDLQNTQVNGDFVAVYDKRVMCALQNNTSSKGTSFLSPIQGSWKDFP